MAKYPPFDRKINELLYCVNEISKQFVDCSPKDFLRKKYRWNPKDFYPKENVKEFYPDHPNKPLILQVFVATAVSRVILFFIMAYHMIWIKQTFGNSCTPIFFSTTFWCNSHISFTLPRLLFFFISRGMVLHVSLLLFQLNINYQKL